MPASKLLQRPLNKYLLHTSKSLTPAYRFPSSQGLSSFKALEPGPFLTTPASLRHPWQFGINISLSPLEQLFWFLYCAHFIQSSPIFFYSILMYFPHKHQLHETGKVQFPIKQLRGHTAFNTKFSWCFIKSINDITMKYKCHCTA